MVKNKNAFTLVEAVISMIIIMLVATVSLASITKVKPQINSSGIRGQYGCWYWDSSAASSLGISTPSGVSNRSLVEWYFDERTPRTEKPVKVSECTLKLDQKPANFYILAAGAGDGENPGQVTTAYIPAISGDITIMPGSCQDATSRTTYIAVGDETISALGAGEPVANKSIYPSNIKSCKVFYDHSKGVTSCDVIPVTTLNGGVEYKIRLNGIDKIIPFSQLKEYRHIAKERNLNFNSIDRNNYALTLMHTRRTSSYRTNLYSDENEDVYVSFELYNSDNVPADRLLYFKENTINNYSTKTRSKMAKMLENIPTLRKSKLTDLFIKMNPGAMKSSDGKEGAVLILW